MAIVTLRDVTVGFGGPPLLDGVSMKVEPGEKVCLVGRNGTGKTTLLRVIEGKAEPDSGEVERGREARIASLGQEVPVDLEGSCFEVVAGGLPEGVEPRVARAVISRLSLDEEARVENMSGGMKRRVMLARAMASGPDLLLLDEPTNHLDLDSIAWLEEFLSRYDKAVLFVSHDRIFASKLASRVLDLDAGNLVSYQGGFDRYRERKEDDLVARDRSEALFDKKLSKEEVWIRQGVRERRTRNEGRVRALKEMREAAKRRRSKIGDVKIQVQEGGRSAKRVARAKDAVFSYDGERRIIDGLSTVVYRGDKVGVIGPNGCGKTTLLRLLMGQIDPTSGSVERGDGLHVAYLDQLRDQLDDQRTVLENVVEKGDKVIVNGKPKHVITYLKDFLFSGERARTPVWVLSGGERNRLLLAKLFTRPANVLVMDEPTNDLDAETLELLEASIVAYEGTVIFVSHDRAFINNVATSTLVFEGAGKVGEYAGGYDDWVAQRPAREEPRIRVGASGRARRRGERPAGPKKLTYAQRLELDDLPGRIEDLEGRIAKVHEEMAAPDIYKGGGEEIRRLQGDLERLEAELEEVFGRWETLETIKEISGE